MYVKKPTYSTSASLWIDNPPPLGSSLNTSTGLGSATPSTQTQTVLSELLATRAFVLAVGDGSQLRTYLAARQKPSKSLDDEIMASVGPDTISTTPGPQVLVISYTGPTPQVAQSVLQKLIAEMQVFSTKYGNVYVSGAINYYDSQVKAASAAVDAAKGNLTRYLQSHPHASATRDPTYAALLSASQAANTQLTQAQSSASQASGALQARANSPILKVIDPPTLPTASSRSKEKDAEAVAGGLIAGMFLSLLIVVLLTPGRPDQLDAVVVGAYAGALMPPEEPRDLAEITDGLGDVTDYPQVPTPPR